MAVRGNNWRDIPNHGADFDGAGMSVLPRDVTSLDDDADDMSPEAVAARAARAAEQSQIAAEVAARLPDAGADDDDDDIQFDMELNKGGKKRTKTRAVRRKRSYKKSKKSYKKSKRCVATRKTHPEH